MAALVRRFFLAGFLIACAFPAAGVETSIYIGKDASELEKNAALELQRYLYAAGDRVLEIRPADAPAGDGYVLGTPETLPDIGTTWPFGLSVPAGGGYILRTIDNGYRAYAVIAAPTPAGVQNGVFGLLNEIGYSFNLAGDSLPDSPPQLLNIVRRGIGISVTPAFGIRGTIPRFSSFSGASAWDPADYEAYIDNVVHMRNNFVGFYIGENDPFAAYSYEKKLVGGEPLPNTSRAVWGGRPTATKHFFAGTSQYFDKAFFGAASSFIDKREESIAAAKKVLRDALNYAKTRALRTAVGFEINGDPFDAGVQSRFEARLMTVLKEYPALDYVFLWQPENFGLNPPESPRPRSLWDSYARQLNGMFDGIADPDRRAEGARIAAFALHARNVLAALRPDVTLVLSGWGGDQWLRYTDLLPGLDKAMPRDVVLAGLDNMPATESISAAYGKLSAERERWPILWLEHDGDLWMPQPNLNAIAGACRDAAQKQCKGLVGAHWRTRDAEEAAGFAAEFAWDPGLTTEKFLARRAQALIGDRHSEELATTLARLQEQGFRWVGGNGNAATAPFAWTVGDADKRGQLADIVDGAPRYTPMANPLKLLLRPIHLAAKPSAEESGLEDLLSYASFAMQFSEAADTLAPGNGIEELVEKEDSAGVAGIIAKSGIADAFQTYARRVSNKGELGALASMNTKVWADLRSRGKLNDEAIAALEAFPEAYRNKPDLLVLPDRVAIAGAAAENVRVTLLARPFGKRQWTEKALERAENASSFALAWPDAAVKAGAFEYALKVRVPKHGALRWPADFPGRGKTKVIIAPRESAPPAMVARNAAAPAVAAAVIPGRNAVQLTWNHEPGVAYTVAREGKVLGTVQFGWFEDLQPPSGRTVQYEVKAKGLVSDATAAAAASVDVPEFPLPEPPKNIKADARGNRIILGWDSNAGNASKYYIQKYDQDGKVIEETYVDADYEHFLQISDHVDSGRAYEYTISAIAPDGRVGAPSERVAIMSSTEPLEPILHLSFKDKSFLAGLATLNERGLALGGKGWAELAPQPEWDPGHALSLTVWVRLNDINGTPVLVCKGSWQRAGYFLQVVNGQIRFYLAGVDTIDAGEITAGKWYHVAATYGFNEMQVYIDGKSVGRKRVSGRPRASDDPLLIGRYGIGDDSYFVRGTMDDVRIYNVPLTPSEVASLFDSTKPGVK